MYAERRHYTPKRCARRLYVLLNELLNELLVISTVDVESKDVLVTKKVFYG